MPLNITSETPRVNRTIAGVSISMPAPYAEGHVVTAGEAQMLNQTTAENFSNNLRKRIEEYVPAGSPEGTATRLATAEEAQAIVDEYAGIYEPGVRSRSGGGGRVAATPIEVEARELATARLKQELAKRSLKQRDVNFTELRDKLLEKNRDTFMAQAEKIVRAREKEVGKAEGDDLFGDIIDGLPGVQQEEATAAE